MDRDAEFSHVSSDTIIEAKPANPKADEWAERIAAQQRSGMSVKQFCKERGLMAPQCTAGRHSRKSGSRGSRDAYD
jgi:hypothetical protein